MSSPKTYSLVISVLFVLALSFSPGKGWGQQEEWAPERAQEQASQIDLSDSQILAFTKAHTRVEEIHKDYQEQLAAAQDPQQQQKIVQTANEKMISIIENEGLDVELYNAIVNEIPNNRALQSRISREMQDLQQE